MAGARTKNGSRTAASASARPVAALVEELVELIDMMVSERDLTPIGAEVLLESVAEIAACAET